MNNEHVARELVKLAKALVSVKGDRRTANYEMAQSIIDKFSSVRGIESSGASDGFNDETTFTITLELVVTNHEAAGRTRGIGSPSEFAIPLRKLGSIVKSTLAGLKTTETVDGEKMTLIPVLDSKIFVPRKKSYKDEFGNRISYYDGNRVNFDVYMTWKS